MPKKSPISLPKQLVLHRLAQPAQEAILAIAICSLLLTSGCGPTDKIESYTVAHEKTAEEKAAEQPKRSADRMLATIVPLGDQAWFFKLTGPRDAVDAERDGFSEFLHSLRFDDPKNPKWSLPAGWIEQPASGLRYATILIPTDERPLELTVTTLAWDAQDETASTLSNINRWRGQMQLEPIAVEDLKNKTLQLTIAGHSATFVALDGRLGAGGMGQPPFAGGAGTKAKPSVGTKKPARDAPSDLTYEVPAGWSPGTMNAMRIAAFEVKDGDQKIEITIATAGGDLLANVNRWRGQIGLNDTTQSELDQQIKQLKVDKLSGDYIELTGPADAPKRQSIYGVVMKHAGQTWFFKLVGDTALAEREKAHFESFVQSVKFKTAEGTGNGQ